MEITMANSGESNVVMEKFQEHGFLKSGHLSLCVQNMCWMVTADLGQGFMVKPYLSIRT